MMKNQNEKQPLQKERSQKDINKTKNRIGCLIMILIGTFLFYE